MDDEAAQIADVGEVAEQLHALDEALAGLDTALQLEVDDGPLALRQVRRGLIRPGR